MKVAIQLLIGDNEDLAQQAKKEYIKSCTIKYDEDSNSEISRLNSWIEENDFFDGEDQFIVEYKGLLKQLTDKYDTNGDSINDTQS